MITGVEKNTTVENFKEIWEEEETPAHIQQSDLEQNIYSPRPNATQRTGRIQERKILRRTHIHPTTDCRTMPGIENTVLYKLYRL